MKKVFKTLLVFLTLTTSIMAQKGFEVQKGMVINVSADELWKMVGPSFVDVYKWSSNVDHAEGKGTPEFDGAVCNERYCDVNVKGFSSISEKITKYDENGKTLAYEIVDGMPGFVTKAVNDWTVVPINKTQSKLVMKADFRVKGLMGTLMKGMMEKKMNETLETVLNDAKIYAETGKTSEAKEQRKMALQKKMKKAA